MTRLPIKPLHLFGVFLILGFALYGMTGIRGAITPYVDIAQARSTADRVQVKGKFDKRTLYSDSLGRLNFELVDFKTNDKFKVLFSGQHPANMAMARDVVAMGTWNPALNAFEADQMNIKCPDKYQSGTTTPPAS